MIYTAIDTERNEITICKGFKSLKHVVNTQIQKICTKKNHFPEFYVRLT